MGVASLTRKKARRTSLARSRVDLPSTTKAVGRADAEAWQKMLEECDRVRPVACAGTSSLGRILDKVCQAVPIPGSGRDIDGKARFQGPYCTFKPPPIKI